MNDGQKKSAGGLARDLPLGIASLLILVLLFATTFWCLGLAAKYLPSGEEWDRRLIRLHAQLR